MLLELNRKHMVAFDATNAQHRADYAMFLKNGNWRHTDRRYCVPDGAAETQGAIQRQLLEYYTSQEMIA